MRSFIWANRSVPVYKEWALTDSGISLCLFATVTSCSTSPDNEKHFSFQQPLQCKEQYEYYKIKSVTLTSQRALLGRENIHTTSRREPEHKHCLMKKESTTPRVGSPLESSQVFVLYFFKYILVKEGYKYRRELLLIFIKKIITLVCVHDLLTVRNAFLCLQEAKDHLSVFYYWLVNRLCLTTSFSLHYELGREEPKPH